MNLKVIFASLICALLLLFAPSKAIAAIVSHAPIDAMVNIVEPTDGATVSETFKVKFGQSGMELVPYQSKLPYSRWIIN